MVDLPRGRRIARVDTSPRVGAVVRRLARDHELRRHPIAVASAIGIVCIAKVLGVVSSITLGTFAAARTFSVAAFARSRAAALGGDVTDAIPEAVAARVFGNRVVHRGIADLIEYGERPEELSTALIAVDRGRQASRALLIGTLVNVVGSVASLAASVAFLTAVSPFIGVLAITTLPFMYRSARRGAVLAARLRAADTRTAHDVSMRTQELTESAELVRSSPARSALALEVAAGLEVDDRRSATRQRQNARSRLTSILPYHGAVIAAGILAGILLHLPIAAVVSSTLVLGWTYFPVRQMLRHLTEDAPALAVDVAAMYSVVDDATDCGNRERGLEPVRVDAATLSGHAIDARCISDRRIAIASVTFHVDAGEWVAITGPSGSGKTTILRAIAGLTTVDHGSVNVGGRDVTAVARNPAGRQSVLHDVVVFAPQSAPILVGRSAHDNCRLGMRDDAVASDADIAASLRDVGLQRIAGDVTAPIAYVSTGERARLGVARALLRKPRVLLLDEPTAGLDNIAAQAVVEALRRVRAAGTTVIVASHDARLTAAADRTIPLGVHLPRAAPPQRAVPVVA